MEYKKLLKKIVPRFLISIKNRRHSKPKAELYCPVCKTKSKSFLRSSDDYMKMWDKHQFIHSIFCFETYNYLIHHCPVCNSTDRNRLYALYLENKFLEYKTTGKKYNFLDIAPEEKLANLIKKNSFINYRSVDLYMPGVDDKADITNFNIYEDNRFDIILCSHVLEHIPNDTKAMSELYRVLKPGAFAIVMVPIVLTLSEDLENPEWTSEADRWKFYGQNDHVRMYSKSGFVRKLEQTGFKVNQFGIDYFGADIFKKYGIQERSVLYVVEK